MSALAGPSHTREEIKMSAVPIKTRELEASFYEDYYGKKRVWVGKMYLYIPELGGVGEAHFIFGVHVFAFRDVACASIAGTCIKYTFPTPKKLAFLKLRNRNTGEEVIVLTDTPKPWNLECNELYIEHIWPESVEVVAIADRYDDHTQSFVWRPVKSKVRLPAPR